MWWVTLDWIADAAIWSIQSKTTVHKLLEERLNYGNITFPIWFFWTLDHCDLQAHHPDPQQSSTSITLNLNQNKLCKLCTNGSLRSSTGSQFYWGKIQHRKSNKICIWKFPRKQKIILAFQYKVTTKSGSTVRTSASIHLINSTARLVVGFVFLYFLCLFDEQPSQAGGFSFLTFLKVSHSISHWTNCVTKI